MAKPRRRVAKGGVSTGANFNIETLIRARGALLEGHFLLSSGLHSDRYVQCAKLFMDPRDAQRLGEELAELTTSDEMGGKSAAKRDRERSAIGNASENVSAIDVVVSPALGGILIGYEIARALGRPFLFTERQDGAMTLRRGFSIEPGARVLIVEDVLTTGKSTGEVARVVRERGGLPVAAASVINRGCTEASLGLPIRSLLDLPLTTYAPNACPLCRTGNPIDKPGSRPRPATGEAI